MISAQFYHRPGRQRAYILIRGATPIVPIVTAKQWPHQVVAMLDLRPGTENVYITSLPGGSEGSPAMCLHGMPHGLVGAILHVLLSTVFLSLEILTKGLYSGVFYF